MKRSFLLIAFYTVFILINAQNNELKEVIKSQLNNGDKKSISKAEKDYAESAAGMELAKNERKRNKSFKIKVLASRKYGKANKVVYKVYKKDLEKFFNNIDAILKKKAERKVKKAGLLMKEAKKKRELSLRLNAPENSYSHLSKADKLEDEAIKNLLDVYEMFIDKKQVIAKENIEKVEKNNVSEEGGDEVKVSEATIVGETEGKESVVNETVEVKDDNTVINESVSESAPKEFVPIEIKGTTGVFFLLQVAASKTPISVDKLELQFKSDIHGDLFGEWYRYFINEKFLSLEEAENYKKELGVKGVFTVAFKNGKKVSLKEALEKEVLVVAPKIDKKKRQKKKMRLLKKLKEQPIVLK